MLFKQVIMVTDLKKVRSLKMLFRTDIQKQVVNGWTLNKNRIDDDFKRQNFDRLLWQIAPTYCSKKLFIKSRISTCLCWSLHWFLTQLFISYCFCFELWLLSIVIHAQPLYVAVLWTFNGCSSSIGILADHFPVHFLDRLSIYIFCSESAQDSTLNMWIW